MMSSGEGPSNMKSRIAILLSITVLATGCARGLLAPQWGVQDGQLSACEGLHGCVSSQATDPDHLVAPLVFVSSRVDARNDLLAVLRSFRDAQVVSIHPSYLRVEFSGREASGAATTLDIAEFYIPAGEQLIQVRSTPRRNMPDSGENRLRIEMVRTRFYELQEARETP